MRSSSLMAEQAWLRDIPRSPAHRPDDIGEERQVKIPRRVNAAWDWVEHHGKVRWVVAIVITVAAVVATARWVPELSTFILGAAVSGAYVRSRMAAREARLRAEVDDLLRSNGALRHEKTMLANGVLSSQSLLTQRLPMIPDVPDAE
jgi:hypothetical protein